MSFYITKEGLVRKIRKEKNGEPSTFGGMDKFFKNEFRTREDANRFRYIISDYHPRIFLDNTL